MPPHTPLCTDVTMSSNATLRANLLIQHGLALPEKNSPFAEALHRFLDGEPLSDSDNATLSLWLRLERPQNIALLTAMQKIESRFIPLLDLTLNGPGNSPADQLAQDTTRLLMDAQSNGLRFAVNLNEDISIGVATVLKGVMTDGESKGGVIGFHFPSRADRLDFAETATVLREAITCCKTIKWVGGSPAVLSLIERDVPQLKLMAINANLNQDELTRVLTLGKNTQLTFKSNSSLAHRAFARFIHEFNKHSASTHWVCHVDLQNTDGSSPKSIGFDDQWEYGSKGQETTTEHLGEALSLLASTPHLHRLTLSHVEWLQQQSLKELTQCASSGSLQTLIIESRQGLDDQQHFNAFGNTLRLRRVSELLEPILGNRYQREFQITLRTTQALAIVSYCAFEVDPLALQIALELTGTATRHALAVVNTNTVEAARAAREQLDAAPGNGGKDSKPPA